MSETQQSHQTQETVKTNKTGLFVGIIVILLAIIIALGVYTYHLAHRPVQQTYSQPRIGHSPQVVHQNTQHPQPRVNHSVPKLLTKTQSVNTQPAKPHPTVQPQVQSTTQQDPLVAMQQQMQQMQHEMDQMAANAFRDQQHFFTNMNVPNTMGHFMQASGFQLNDNGDHYTVTVNASGMEKNQINVKLTGQVLTVNGKADHQAKKKHQTQHYMREFSQTMTLPEAVNSQGMKTQYKKGILTITIPKRVTTHTQQVH